MPRLPHQIRYIHSFVASDLEKKMVFLGGPRQVGKTTLALSLLQPFDKKHPAYFNWDYPAARKILLSAELPADHPLFVLDEVHKYRHWRNLVKGLYDHYGDDHQILVTGSARLDYYRRGGDSLLGRYHYLRLHPFSFPEIRASSPGDLDTLLEFGGFPEPLLSQDRRTWRRWSEERKTRLIQDDLRSLEQVREISQIEHLMALLPDRVGSVLSIRSLVTEIQASHEAVSRWVTILDHLYYSFRISPYGPPRTKAVKKEQKLFLWDWSEVADPGARLENLVASQLLKFCHFRQDTEGHHMELRFIRDTEGREVDFVVLQDAKPLFAVECKSGDRELSRSVRYFAERSKIPIFYQLHRGSTERKILVGKTPVHILPLVKWLSDPERPLP